MIKIPPKNRLADPGTMAIQTSLGATAAEARAFGELGQALGQSGKQLGQFANKMARADNLQKVSDDELNWGSLEAEFNAGLQGDLKPESWLGNFNAVIDRAQSQNNQDLSPEAQRIRDAKFKEWQVKAKGKIGLQAASFKVQQARESGYLRANMAEQIGDFETAGVIYDEMDAAGVDAPERIAKSRQDMERTFQKSNIEATLFPGGGDGDFDPTAAQQAVDSADKLTAVERSTYARQIRTNTNRFKGQFAEDLAWRVATGEEQITEDSVVNYVEAGHMDKSVGTRWLENIKKNNVQVDWKEFGFLQEAAIGYDRTGDTDLKRFAELRGRILTSGMPSDQMRELLNTVDDSRDQHEKNPEASDARAAVTRMLRRLATPSERGVGAFGAKDDARGNPIDETYNQSEIKLNNYRTMFRRWQMGEGKNATAGEAIEWMNNAIQEDLNKVGGVKAANRTTRGFQPQADFLSSENMDFILGIGPDPVKVEEPKKEEPFKVRNQFDADGYPQF